MKLEINRNCLFMFEFQADKRKFSQISNQKR